MSGPAAPAASDTASESAASADTQSEEVDREFQRVLASASELKQLEAHMKKTLSDENLRFHCAVESFKKLASDKRPQRAREIVHEFIDDSGRSQVTLPGDLQAQLRQTAAAGVNIEASLFDRAHKIILYHLRHDVFPRFLKEPAYERVVAARAAAAAAGVDSGTGTRRAGGGGALPTGTGAGAGAGARSNDFLKSVRKMGWLNKRSDNLHAWRKRFCILRGGRFEYYAQQDQEKPTRWWPLADMAAGVVSEEKYKRPLCFELLNANDKTLVFQAHSEGERAAWVQLVQEAADTARRDRARPQTGMIKCRVVRAVTREDGLRPYTVYEIEVESGQLRWHVWKRYSEFEALHKFLMSESPWSPLLERGDVPPFPRRIFKQLDDVVVQSRLIAFDEWLRALLRVPEMSGCVPLLTFMGLLQNEGAVGEPREPQRRNRIPPERLLDLAESGDLLLSCTPSTLGSMQRTLLGTEWDHVALVVRQPIFSKSKHNTVVFEATSSGVSTYPLETRLLEFGARGFVFALRRLRWHRSEAALMQLEAFVDETLGKGYSLKGLIRPRRTSNSSFFCSELVVAAYKRLGVMPADHKSNLLPKHFASETELLQFEGGASLDREMILEFGATELADARHMPPRLPHFASTSRILESSTGSGAAAAAAGAVGARGGGGGGCGSSSSSGVADLEAGSAAKGGRTQRSRSVTELRAPRSTVSQEREKSWERTGHARGGVEEKDDVDEGSESENGDEEEEEQGGVADAQREAKDRSGEPAPTASSTSADGAPDGDDVEEEMAVTQGIALRPLGATPPGARPKVGSANSSPAPGSRGATPSPGALAGSRQNASSRKKLAALLGEDVPVLRAPPRGSVSADDLVLYELQRKRSDGVVDPEDVAPKATPPSRRPQQTSAEP